MIERFVGLRLGLISGLIVGSAALTTMDASAETIELKFGHNIAVGTPTDLGAKRFAELVEERSNGTIVVTDHPGGQLGNEQQMIEGLQLGTIDMAGIVGATYGNVVEEANVLGLLYAFRDAEHMQEAMAGEVGARLSQRIQEQTGIRVIDASWYYGTRHLTANKPVSTPDDLQGMKVRVVPAPIFEAGWNALGATPTPVDFKELFTALQTNTVDGQENPVPVIKSVGVPLVNDHLSLTGHVVANMIIGMSQDAYQRLSSEQIELIEKAAHDAGVYQSEVTLRQEQKLLKEFEDDGMTIVEPDREAFAAEVADLASTWQGGVLADIYQMIQTIE